MEGITLEQLTTVAGIAGFTTVADLILWSVVQPTDAFKARFGPIVAVVTGVLIGTVAGLVLGIGGRELGQVVLNGIAGGFASAGLYDVLKSKAGLTG